MTITFTAPIEENQLKPRITVIGVGGAGGNAVNNMINNHLEGVEFMVANTDAQALQQSFAERRIQLGTTITHGLGAGSRPDMGRAAAEEAIDELGEHFHGAHMVFIAAGMGGGTGTGAAPVIARLAREQGMLTVGVVTKPFQFEGSNRMRIAEAGIEEMQQFVDTLIVIPNQNLFRIANEKTTFADAFSMADDVLHSGVRGVTDLMVVPGLINLDFADIRAVMSEMGKAMMGTGEADGEERAKRAAEAAISNPLLDDVSMKGARGVLINITGGSDMTLFEVDEAANRIGDEVDPNANIIFGSAMDPKMDGKLRVSVVATGIDVEANVQPRPVLKVYSEPALKVITGTPEPALEPIRLTETMATNAPEALAEVPSAWQPAVADPVMEASAAESAVSDESPVAQELPISEETAPPAPAATTAPADTPFMPPPPAAAHTPQRAEAVADPFKEASAATSAPPEVEKRRGPSLFKRMTGSSRARRETPELAEKREVSPPTIARAPTPAPAPATAPVAAAPAPKPTTVENQLDGVDRIARPKAAPQSEEDLLEIPAFLRRQAN